eukprot:scaffold189501_cov30-Tisochrysis_lutea.AAC.1
MARRLKGMRGGVEKRGVSEGRGRWRWLRSPSPPRPRTIPQQPLRPDFATPTTKIRSILSNHAHHVTQVSTFGFLERPAHLPTIKAVGGSACSHLSPVTRNQLEAVIGAEAGAGREEFGPIGKSWYSQRSDIAI